jgi:hypothetical protein
VRKVSCSPWCNIDIAAENIHGILSRQQTQPLLGRAEGFDTGLIAADLRRTRKPVHAPDPARVHPQGHQHVKYKPAHLGMGRHRHETVLDG